MIAFPVTVDIQSHFCLAGMHVLHKSACLMKYTSSAQIQVQTQSTSGPQLPISATRKPVQNGTDWILWLTDYLLLQVLKGVIESSLLPDILHASSVNMGGQAS